MNIFDRAGGWLERWENWQYDRRMLKMNKKFQKEQEKQERAQRVEAEAEKVICLGGWAYKLVVTEKPGGDRFDKAMSRLLNEPTVNIFVGPLVTRTCDCGADHDREVYTLWFTKED